MATLSHIYSYIQLKVIYNLSVFPSSSRILGRNNGLLWKNVSKLFICSLHFESKCFKNKRKLQDFKVAQPSQGVAQGVAHPPVVEEDHPPQGGEAAHPPAVEVV